MKFFEWLVRLFPAEEPNADYKPPTKKTVEVQRVTGSRAFESKGREVFVDEIETPEPSYLVKSLLSRRSARK